MSAGTGALAVVRVSAVVGLLLGLLCGRPCHAACLVSSPPHLARSFNVLTRREFIGLQDERLSLANATVSLLKSTKPSHVGDLDCSVFRDTLALVDSSGATWDMLATFDTAFALQECGALAIVQVAYDPTNLPESHGMAFYNSDHNCCKSRRHAIQRYVLGAWVGDVREVVDALDAGIANVTMQCDGVDRNPWVDDLFRHPAFFVFARVVLPIGNLVVVGLALRALRQHARRRSEGRRKQHPSVFDVMQSYIVLALCFQVAGAAIRFAYCVTTPFFSNSILNFQQSNFLINITLPLQLPSIMVVSAMCRRIVSMRRNTSPPSKRWVVPSAAYCVLVFALDLVAGYGRGYALGWGLFLVLSNLLALVTVLVSIGGATLPFLLRMRESRRSQRTNRHQSAAKLAGLRVRRQFVTSIERGTIGLVVQLCAVLIFGFVPTVRVPAGVGTLTIMYYAGLTATSFYFTLAFAPIVRTNFNRSNTNEPQRKGSSKQLAAAYLVDDAPANAEWKPPPLEEVHTEAEQATPVRVEGVEGMECGLVAPEEVVMDWGDDDFFHPAVARRTDQNGR